MIAGRELFPIGREGQAGYLPGGVFERMEHRSPPGIPQRRRRVPVSRRQQLAVRRERQVLDFLAATAQAMPEPPAPGVPELHLRSWSLLLVSLGIFLQGGRDRQNTLVGGESDGLRRIVDIKSMQLVAGRRLPNADPVLPVGSFPADRVGR